MTINTKHKLFVHSSFRMTESIILLNGRIKKKYFTKIQNSYLEKKFKGKLAALILLNKNLIRFAS